MIYYDLIVKDAKNYPKQIKEIIPNFLGKFTTYEDRLEAVLMAGTINQNNEQLRMNRLAIKRGLEHARKNPRLIPQKEYKKSEKMTMYPNDASAMAFPFQNVIAANANYDPTTHRIFKKLNPTPDLVRLVLSSLMQHERSHIIFINWIEQKYGEKMKREIALRSEEATYKYSEAIQKYITAIQQNGFDPNHPAVLQAKEEGIIAERFYYNDPLEKIALIIEKDILFNNNINAIETNLPEIYQIISDAVKDIKAGRR